MAPMTLSEVRRVSMSNESKRDLWRSNKAHEEAEDARSIRFYHWKDCASA
jgi:hypothetical protein